MDASKETKRLFVGGLGQAISETDLQNQFNRFGEVSDVEIITRKDDQGNAQKIFAYINIKITEADLKKCISILNKTKWKGGTLQVQLAKESFLHRLAQEREAATAKKEKSTTGNATLLEKVGGMNFHMKAVPGTEVPGHKNWVVSKFGRILPVLHLKNHHKHKIMKYDPSKYCHNLKKIGEDFTSTVPINSLTWELEGGNDPISKKRRGEFSDFNSPSKKIMKVQEGNDSTGSKVPDTRRKTSWVIEHDIPILQQHEQKTSHSIAPSKSKSCLLPNSDTEKPKNVLFQSKKRNYISDDIDSEDELRMMIEEEENLQKTRCASENEAKYDSFEVVGNDFKSDINKHSLTNLGLSSTSCNISNNVGSDCEYDSGDTDEIIAMKKTTGKISAEKAINKTSKKNELSNNCIKEQKIENNTKSDHSHGVKSLNPKSPSDSSSSENEEDEEYNSMMKNCPRVTLTLADLEQLAGSQQEVLGKDKSDGPQTSSHCNFDRASKSHKIPYDLNSDQACICPEEIIASLLQEENTYDKQNLEEKNVKPKFQAFKGIGSLYGKESVEKTSKQNLAFNNINTHQNSLKHVDVSNISVENGSLCANGLSNKLISCKPVTANITNHIQSQKGQFNFENQDHKVVFSNSSEEGSENSISCLLPKAKKSLSLGGKIDKVDIEKDTCHVPKNKKVLDKVRSDSNSPTSLKVPPKISPRKDPQKSTSFSMSPNNVSDASAKDKHAEDNQKRLAALEARHKAREVQKKLVHNALANLDGHPEAKSTHIIFASDGESETEQETQKQNHIGEGLLKECADKACGKLFDSSDEKESDSEDDSDRFKIKPQFEGRAGQKLMDLQLHFGSDDRFRMDSRFLESDSEEEQEEVKENTTAEEEELAAEKKKTLDVVQSVLNINLNNPTNKAATKKFKDIIRYDPTRHDHASYERKKEDKPKESKAKRKKKREEAEKLPEVSKEMYYNIATDLKEIFQTTKDTSEKEEDIPWNEDCGKGESEEIHNAETLTSEVKQTNGFTFSFFESNTEDVKEDIYKVETVKPGKIMSRGDPHFQDSSSGEEEDVAEEAEDKMSNSGEAASPEKETTRFFFFSKNDERLHASNLFWRGAGSDISTNSWEARKNSLLLDCRKKHKEAKRKLKLK